MARTPKLRGGLKGTTSSLRPREKKIDYNEHKLSLAASKPPVVKKVVKKVPKKKTTTKKAVSGKGKGGATYLDLVKRIFKDTHKNHPKGFSVPAILNIVAKSYPERANRKYIRLALLNGVKAKSIVQTRQTFRLSARELHKIEAKKTRTKKSKATTKKVATKKTSTKRKSTDEKKETGKTTKKAKTDKTKTKKTKTDNTKTKRAKTDKTKTKRAKADKTSKKSSEASSPSPSPKKAKKAKKVIESVRGTIAEGEGNPVWQYYDNGWQDYASDATGIVEGVYQEYKHDGTGLEVRPIKSGYFSYQIDFRNLTQTNTQTQTVRNIQRVLRN